MVEGCSDGGVYGDIHSSGVTHHFCSVWSTGVNRNGPQFVAAEFQAFCTANGIHQIRVAAYHPSSNGLAERAVRIFKGGLKKQVIG